MAVLALVLQLAVPLVASAQNVTNWIAFNEHAPSNLTDPNVSTYNMRGWVLATDPGTVHPVAGPLTNYVTGESGYAPGQPLNARLIASTLLRNPDLFPNATLGYPDVGTPAYDVFMPGGANITDLANAGSSIGLGNFSGNVGQDTVVLTFSNLDPSMRYKFRGTAVRAGTAVGTHHGRWTISSIAGADSSVDAGTAGILTSANTPGVPGLSLTNGQQVFQSGINIQGDMVGWDEINPGPDGSFSIITKGYNGPVYDFYNNMGPDDGIAPSGGPGSVFTNAYGALGYALSDIMITEYGPLTPVSIATPPVPSTTVPQAFPLSLSVKAVGSAPFYQWYKDGSLIPDATGATFSIGSVALGDSGDYTVVVNNSLNSVTSAVAHVNVEADLVKPFLVSAIAGGDFTQVIMTFNERVDVTEATDPFNYQIGETFLFESATLVSAGTPENGTVVNLKLSTPLTENTLYHLLVSQVHDLSGNQVDNTVLFPFRSWVVSSAGGVTFEIYTGIGGTPIAGLYASPNFPNNPAVTTNLTTFNTREFLPGDGLETYGGRLRGLFIPPTSGAWIFYLKSDDAGELYFNPTGPTAAGKILLTAELACCTAYSAHASAPQSLVAGRAYYLEADYKEGGGGDFCQVAAKRVDDPAVVDTLPTIPPALLGFPSAPAGVAGDIGITQPPVGITTNENQLVSFSVAATNTYDLPMVFQWRKNGVDVPGVIGTNFSFVATTDDDNAEISVVASIVGAKVSSAVTLHVIPDTIPPVVESASADATFTNIVLRFSELLSRPTAEDNFGYLILDGPGNLMVLTATLQPDGRTVILNLDGPMQVDTTYTLGVNSPADIAGNGMAPGTTVFIRSWKLAPGFVTFQTYDAGGGNSVSILTSHPSFPNSPRETLYLDAFDTRRAYPDDSHESYGGRLSGVFIPPTTGNWIFYLNADDGSELYLNPVNADPAGKMLIQSRVDCCATFGANASAPQFLMANQPYYLEALYKEGGGGDYCRVAAKLDTDPAEPGTLSPIPSSMLGTYINPLGLSLAITAHPTNAATTRSEASQILGLEGFNAGSGKFTVISGIEGGSAPPANSSWLYQPAQGVWNVLGADGVRNSALSSPYYYVTTAGTISMTFAHRYNFEKDTVNWDGGLVRVSANRGPYTTVPGTSITGDTYQTDRTIGGNSPPLRNQFAYNGQSAGFVTTNYVTSTADLGTFNEGDVLSVQFIAAWDEGTIAAPAPAWEITSVDFSPSVENSSADGAVTFTAAASATVNFSPFVPYYQWQRDDGAGFVNIIYANAPTFSFVPSARDDGAVLRCLVSAPCTNVFTTAATVYVVPRHTIALDNGAAVIAWPAPSPGYVLERTADLLTPATTVWTPVGIIPTVVNGMNTVTVPASGAQSFFRFRRN